MVWVAGILVTKSIVKISREVGFGDMVGGLVFLAIITNLPEIAITTAAVQRNELDLAISNILGGIALQTVVICLFDFFRSDKRRSLSYEASSNQVIVSALLVIFILSLVMVGFYFPSESTQGIIPLPELLIAICWLIALIIIHFDRQALKKPRRPQTFIARLRSIEVKNFVIFLIAVAGTFAGGFYLERVSYELAGALGMTSTIFGATILAVITALPEISTGIEALLLKHNRLAVSDIFGSNAFLPCLFLPAAIFVGHGTIAMAKNQDRYLTALGIILTVLYAAGLTIKTERKFLNLGFDTIAVLIFYTAGIFGLLLVKN